MKKLRVELSGLDPHTNHLLECHLLQRGGYPFERNDFTREEWMALGVIRDEFESAQAERTPMLALTAGGK